MKTLPLFTMSAVLFLLTPTSGAASPKYSAKVPSEIVTPNHVSSEYLGEMHYIDGAPTEETYSKTRDFVDTANAVRLFLSGIPTASIQGLLAGHESMWGLSDTILAPFRFLKNEGIDS